MTSMDINHAQNDMDFSKIVDDLMDSHFVELNKSARNRLYDYMIDNDIDPNDFRMDGDGVWLA